MKPQKRKVLIPIIFIISMLDLMAIHTIYERNDNLWLEYAILVFSVVFFVFLALQMSRNKES